MVPSVQSNRIKVPDENDSFDLGDYIPYLIHQVHRGILQDFEKGLVDHGASLAEWRVLAALAHHGTLGFGDLALSSGLEPPTLVRVLTAMEGKKWVRREPSSEDRRATNVDVTADGRALARSIVPAAMTSATKALVGLSTDEVEFLRRLLQRMQINIGAR